MKKIKFVTSDKQWPWLRQTPNHDGIINGAQFIFDSSCTDYDFLVVFDGAGQDLNEHGPKERTIFVSAEPQNVKRYNNDFLAQFGCVLTTDRQTRHPNIIYTQVGLPWHIGAFPGMVEKYASAMKFKDFENWYPEKTKLVSVICSNKSFTPQHRQRLEFAQALKAHFGDRLDIYGRGFHEIDDKCEALTDYRYHIALENCDFKDYWTEKIADPVLSLTYPIYWGCVNLEDYLPVNSFSRIDIANPAAAVKIIEDIIASDMDIARREQMIEARRRILNTHNIFALLDEVTEKLSLQLQRNEAAASYKILQESTFLPAPSFLKKVRTKMISYINKSSIMRSTGLKTRYLALRLKDRLIPPVNFIRVNTKHYYNMLTDVHYRNHQGWLKASGDQKLRYDYALNDKSVVIDVGGYKGEWADDVYQRFGSKIFVLEPVRSFAEIIKNRFANNDNVKVFECGLGAADTKMAISLEDNASSVFKNAGQLTEIDIRDAHAFIRDEKIQNIDLLKLNIEGGEYEVLQRLIDAGDINKIKDIQVQFHLFVPDARKQYKNLASKLSATHKLTWRYAFVWENWRRKDVA